MQSKVRRALPSLASCNTLSRYSADNLWCVAPPVLTAHVIAAWHHAHLLLWGMRMDGTGVVCDEQGRYHAQIVELVPGGKCDTHLTGVLAASAALAALCHVPVQVRGRVR